ncbi:MAG: hypothetical protein ACFNKF_07970 [Treponema lecithinolyticum]|uniref:hypothetical protein n=1 Tax=Treponema lecithinolyticum TaxID=53418 RepID=UPI00361781B6
MNLVSKNAVKTALFGIFLIVCATAHTEQLHSPTWGYYIDIVEGFELSNKHGKENYQFAHSLFPATLVIQSWEKGRYKNAEQALQTSLQKLKAAGDVQKIQWRSNECALSLFDMQLAGVPCRGWAACAPLETNKGLTMILCYCPSQNFESLQQLIVSTIDAFSSGASGLHESGIFTSYAYPKQGDKAIALNVGGKKVQTFIDQCDIEASEFLIEREYAVLTAFASSPLWKKAWQRYYRMIYRDSYKRLEKAAFSIHNALIEDKINNTVKNNTKNQSDSDKVLAQTLLSWVQNFPYEREQNSSDFTALPAILTGKASDCDSRALLLAVLMSQMNYKTMMFVSAEYSHALFGIDIPGKGARLEENGIRYLLGETTGKVDIGLVPQDMSDMSKWIAISGLF